MFRVLTWTAFCALCALTFACAMTDAPLISQAHSALPDVPAMDRPPAVPTHTGLEFSGMLRLPVSALETEASVPSVRLDSPVRARIAPQDPLLIFGVLRI